MLDESIYFKTAICINVDDWISSDWRRGDVECDFVQMNAFGLFKTRTRSSQIEDAHHDDRDIGTGWPESTEMG